MTEIGDRYRRRADAFEALIMRVAPAQWGDPSPVRGWSAEDIVAHVVDYSGHVLREKTDAADVPDFAEFATPADAFCAIRQRVQEVLDDSTTAPNLATYLDLAVSFDLPQHGWDLAKATGQDPTIDADEVELLWRSLSEVPHVWEWQRENGWYGAPVPVPEGAPLQDRVLGLLGRDPAWAPRANL